MALIIPLNSFSVKDIRVRTYPPFTEALYPALLSASFTHPLRIMVDTYLYKVFFLAYQFGFFASGFLFSFSFFFFFTLNFPPHNKIDRNREKRY